MTASTTHALPAGFEDLAPWTDQIRAYRVDGFYERFPAKGEIERVSRIHRELAKLANIEIKSVL